MGTTRWTKLETPKIVTPEVVQLRYIQDRYHEVMVFLRDDHTLKAMKLLFSDKIFALINRELVNEIIEELTVIDPTGLTVDSHEVELSVVSYLEDSQKEALERVLTEKFGSIPTIGERLVPELVAGIVIKIGSIEIEGSLSSRCREYDSEFIRWLENPELPEQAWYHSSTT